MSTPDPLEQVTASLREAIAGAIKDAQAELTTIAEAGGNAAGGGLLSDIGSVASVLGILGVGVALLDPEFAVPVSIAGAAEAAGGKLGAGFGTGYFMGYFLYQFATPYLNYITHFVANEAQSEIFDPATAADLASKGIISDSFGQSEAGGGGYDSSHFDALLTAARNRPDLAALLELFRRQAIQSQDLESTLGLLGYEPFFVSALATLSRNLLSPADLALAVLRQDMDQDVAQQYAATLGYIAQDFQTLLLNTGEPPGPEQLMEALRRGYVDQTRFAKGIAESRLRPEWLDVLLNLRYSPMSVADTVRAVVENYITSDEGQAIAEQNGLLPEHWPILLESWGRPLAHLEMRTLVNRGLATREDFDQAMRESDIKDKYIDWSFQVGQRLIPERLIVTALDHGSITPDEATTRLEWLGYSDEDIQLLIALGTAEGKTTKHALTRADIVALYEDGKMARADALSRLTSLGYTAADAEAVLEIADLKSAASALRVQERSIETSYKAGHLTQQQATDQLTAAGVNPTQAVTLVASWQQVKGRAVKELTEAQILKLGADLIIQPEDCLNRLVAYGLSQGDALLLMQLEGVPNPNAPAPTLGPQTGTPGPGVGGTGTGGTVSG